MTADSMVPLSDLQKETYEMALNLGMRDFGRALISQYELPGTYEKLIFEERLKELLKAREDGNAVMRFNRLRKNAKFADLLPLNLITVDSSRGITERLIAEINSLNWFRARETLMVTGATGTGKTALLCAIGLHLCRNGIPVRYFKTGDFLENYKNRTPESQKRYRESLARTGAVIFDDFGVSPFSNADITVLFEVTRDLYGLASFMIGSRVTGKGVFAGMERVSEGASSDAVIDRLSKPMRRIPLSGESMRGRTSHDLAAKEAALKEMKP